MNSKNVTEKTEQIIKYIDDLTGTMSMTEYEEFCINMLDEFDNRLLAIESDKDNTYDSDDDEYIPEDECTFDEDSDEYNNSGGGDDDEDDDGYYDDEDDYVEDVAEIEDDIHIN
jgi:hypothetical protein